MRDIAIMTAGAVAGVFAARKFGLLPSLRTVDTTNRAQFGIPAMGVPVGTDNLSYSIPLAHAAAAFAVYKYL